MIKKILKKFFSISEYSEQRYLITLFGIKIRKVKPEYEILRRKNSYHYYKKNNIDITTLPPAEGEFRDFQLATLALLIDFDKICKQNDIHYWLDFGTLIGAMRHNGFIPWDDDIDLGIFRKDYERIMDVVNNNTVNPNIIAEYDIKGTFIKIKHRESEDLFVDLFPVDEYGEIISREEQLEKTKEIKEIARKYHKDIILDYSFEQRRELITQARKEKVLVNELPKDVTKMQYIWGIDFPHSWKNWFTNYDEYFPFKTITFEGFEFPCMNKPDEYLRKVYGDYMAYPKKMHLGHNIFNNKRTDEDRAILKQIIKEKGLDK